MGGISPDKPAASCAECFTWGVLPGSCCRACYTFRNLHPAGECAACHRIVAVKQDYCRLCRLQALEEAKAAGKPTVSESFLRGVRHQQLFFARMHRDHYRVPGRVRLGKLGTRGLRPKAAAIEPPETAWAGIQLQLPFDLRHDYQRFDRRQHADLTNPAVIRARRAARTLGEARGWSHELAKRIDEGLVVLLSGHIGEDKVRYSELLPAVRHRGRIAEVLDHLGLLDDDRIPAFETWLERKLDGLAPGIRTATEDWIRTLYRSKNHRCTSNGVTVLLGQAPEGPGAERSASPGRSLADSHLRGLVGIAPARTRSSVASLMKTDMWFDVQR
jgi:hypothetical protein